MGLALVWGLGGVTDVLYGAMTAARIQLNDSVLYVWYRTVLYSTVGAHRAEFFDFDL